MGFCVAPLSLASAILFSVLCEVKKNNKPGSMSLKFEKYRICNQVDKHAGRAKFFLNKEP